MAKGKKEKKDKNEKEKNEIVETTEDNDVYDPIAEEQQKEMLEGSDSKKDKHKKNKQNESPPVENGSGSLEKLTEQQLKSFHEIKEIVAKWELNEVERNFCTDACLLRYLRARDYKVNLSSEMLKATLQWRKEYKPEAITVKDVWTQLRAASNYIRGFDKAGHPICYMRTSRDPPGTATEKLQLIVYVLELATRVMDSSKNVEKIVYIIDLSGFSMFASGSDPRIASSWIHILQNHYPERLHKIYVLDAPFVFSGFYRLISPLVDSNTKRKIEFVHEKTPEKRKKNFLNFFDENNLESHCGGLLDPKEPLLTLDDSPAEYEEPTKQVSC